MYLRLKVLCLIVCCMLESILSFEVQDLLPFSDHCPLHYAIQCNITTESQCRSGNETAKETSNHCRFRLNTIRMESLVSEFSKPSMIAQMRDMVRNHDTQEGASGVEEFLIKVRIVNSSVCTQPTYLST